MQLRESAAVGRQSGLGMLPPPEAASRRNGLFSRTELAARKAAATVGTASESSVGIMAIQAASFVPSFQVLA